LQEFKEEEQKKIIKSKKKSLCRAGQAVRFSGGLGLPDFKTIGT